MHFLFHKLSVPICLKIVKKQASSFFCFIYFFVEKGVIKTLKKWTELVVGLCPCSGCISYLCSTGGLREGDLLEKNFQGIHQRFPTWRQKEALIGKNWCKANKLQRKMMSDLQGLVKLGYTLQSN